MRIYEDWCPYSSTTPNCVDMKCICLKEDYEKEKSHEKEEKSSKSYAGI